MGGRFEVTFLSLVKDWWTWVVTADLVRVRICLFAAAMDTFLSHLDSLYDGRTRSCAEKGAVSEQTSANMYFISSNYLNSRRFSLRAIGGGVVVQCSNVWKERVPGERWGSKHPEDSSSSCDAQGKALWGSYV